MTGTLTAELTDVWARQSGVSPIQALVRANWLHAVDFLLISHIWLGEWRFLVVRTWMYRAIEAVLLAGILGLALRLFRPYADVCSRRLAICAALAAGIWLAPAYHALATYQIRGVAESFGYYAPSKIIPAPQRCGTASSRARLGKEYGVTTTLVFMASDGPKDHSGLLPGRGRGGVPGGGSLGAVASDMGARLMPYYAGLTAHSASGSVPAMHLGMLSDGGFHRLFGNLAVFKAPGISGGVLEILWVAFLLAAVGIAAIAFFAAHRDRTEP